jgi:hypothetical protein
MAFWDPIRDAIQTTSVNAEKPAKIQKNGLSPSTPTTPTLVIPAHSSVTSSPPTTTTPRATSLAMLLNDSTTYRSSPSPVQTSARPPLPPSSAGSGSKALSLDLLMNPASPTRKPLNPDPSTLGPSKINPKSSPPPVQQPMKQPPIPYNPQRISQARDVLIPLTQADIRTFSNPSNSLRRALRSRGTSQQEQDDGSYSPSQPQAASSRLYPPPQTHSQNQMDVEFNRKRKREEEEHPVHRSPRRPKDTDNMMVAHHCKHMTFSPQVIILTH